MKQLIERCFEATKKRGCITNQTTIKDFNDKLFEEVREVEVQSLSYSFDDDIVTYEDLLFSELADVAAVAFNYIKFLGGDPIEEYEKITIKNEERAVQVENEKIERRDDHDLM